MDKEVLLDGYKTEIYQPGIIQSSTKRKNTLFRMIALIIAIGLGVVLFGAGMKLCLYNTSEKMEISQGSTNWFVIDQDSKPSAPYSGNSEADILCGDKSTKPDENIKLDENPVDDKNSSGLLRLKRGIAPSDHDGILQDNKIEDKMTTTKAPTTSSDESYITKAKFSSLEKHFDAKIYRLDNKAKLSMNDAKILMSIAKTSDEYEIEFDENETEFVRALISDLGKSGMNVVNHGVMHKGDVMRLYLLIGDREYALNRLHVSEYLAARGFRFKNFDNPHISKTKFAFLRSYMNGNERKYTIWFLDDTHDNELRPDSMEFTHEDINVITQGVKAALKYLHLNGYFFELPNYKNILLKETHGVRPYRVESVYLRDMGNLVRPKTVGEKLKYIRAENAFLFDMSRRLKPASNK